MTAAVNSTVLSVDRCIRCYNKDNIQKKSFCTLYTFLFTHVFFILFLKAKLDVFKNVLSEIQGCANNIFFVHCFNFYEINLLENIQKKKREIKFLMASFFHPYLNLICYPKFSTHNT